MSNEYEFRGYHIREDMMEALHRYVNKGLPPGHFLTAVLAHDLMEAVQRADKWNLGQLPAYAAYMYNELPGNCHGSYATVMDWITHFNSLDKGETDVTTPESGTEIPNQ